MLGRAREELSDLFFAEMPNYFRWCEKPPRQVRELLSALQPGERREHSAGIHLGNDEAVVCASATLSNSGTFGYLKSALGWRNAMRLSSARRSIL